MKSLFEKIIDRELPGEILYEDEEIICIKDKFPQAKVHILLIPKKCIPSIDDLEPSDYPILSKIFQKAKDLAREFEIADGYRMVVNRGAKAGQTIFHLHFHLLGGGQLSGKMG